MILMNFFFSSLHYYMVRNGIEYFIDCFFFGKTMITSIAIIDILMIESRTISVIFPSQSCLDKTFKFSFDKLFILSFSLAELKLINERSKDSRRKFVRKKNRNYRNREAKRVKKNSIISSISPRRSNLIDFSNFFPQSTSSIDVQIM